MSEILSPEAYILQLKLDDDMAEDIQQEIDDATKAWQTVFQDKEFVDESSFEGESSHISSLMSILGTTYCEEDHGVELRSRMSGNESVLSKYAFIDWYVRWVFRQDDIEGDDDPEKEISDEKVSTSTGWTGISWSVKPVSDAVDGETWKCSKCRIINQWNQRKCLACDSDAPHADTLQPEPSSSNATVFSFGTSTAPTPFSFIGAPAAAASNTSSGFSFSNAPQVSSGTTPPTGFSFTNAPAAATSTSSSGFTFQPSTTK